ncbi:MAG: ComEA family DNA-binding protein [bacterium]|nr:ComEA family DNA-binding protein [bacterium]
MATRFLRTLAAVVAAAAVLASTVDAAGKVNINTASRWRLEKLPGVGPDIAQLIIAYRRDSGGFRSVSELGQIPGIGGKKLEGLKRVATVGRLAERDRL